MLTIDGKLIHSNPYSNDPDNHNDVITNLEPDILECEVKWALGSIATNKASGGDGIPVELSKFAGILSVALAQHHLSGFETAQLECHHLH